MKQLAPRQDRPRNFIAQTVHCKSITHYLQERTLNLESYCNDNKGASDCGTLITGDRQDVCDDARECAR